VIWPEILGEKMLPEIVIGSSSRYINKMKVPYQATSYVQQIQGVMAKDPISIRYLENPLEDSTLTGGIEKIGDMEQ
jgi:hypothetical protein